jgi:hypothetical protein
MAFFRGNNSSIERAAMALAAAGGVAHAAFFTLFAWRVIGRDGFGTVGWAILALFALIGMGLNFAGFWLVRSSKWRRWGYMAISVSTAIAGALLGIATWVE